MVLPSCQREMNKPSYDLGLIKGLVKDGSWRATVSARDGALELGFDDEDMCDCIVNYLRETHSYKTYGVRQEARVDAGCLPHHISG
jgi:hypothetical protein